MLCAASVGAKEGVAGDIIHVCRGDQVASTEGYRNGFREKNRLKRLVFLVRDTGAVGVREGDSQEITFSDTGNSSQSIARGGRNANSFHLNLDNMRFMAASPGGYLSGGHREKPWLIAGNCRSIPVR